MGSKAARTLFFAVAMVMLAGTIFATGGQTSTVSAIAGMTCDVGGVSPRCLPDEELWAHCVDGQANTTCEASQGGDNNRTLDLRMNYTRTNGATEATWLIVADNATWGIPRAATFHIELPAACVAQAPLQLRYQDHSFMHQGGCFDAGTVYSCWNGMEWQILNDASIGFGETTGGSCTTNRGVLSEQSVRWAGGAS